MATYICIVKLYPSQTGQTLTAQVYNSSNVLQSVTDSFTELGGGEYKYQTASLADGFTGYVKFLISGVYQTSTDISIPAASTVDLSAIETQLDSIEADIANVDDHVDDVLTAVLALGNEGVTIVSPFATSTDLQIVRGDSYSGTTKLVYSSDDWSLTGKTLSFEIKDNQTGTEPTVAHTLAIISSTSLSLSLTSAATDDLELGTDRYSYSIRATSAGETVTLVRGSISVADSY
jgi:hypothetical protein